MALTVFRIRRDVIAALRRRRPQIYGDLERQVAGLRSNPRLFFAKPNVQMLVIYLQGYDNALHGVPLEGFFYWLELQWNRDGKPRHWMGGLPAVARQQAGAQRSEARVFDAACAVLERFFAYRRRYGTATLARKYMERRGRQIAQQARRKQAAAEVPTNTSLERARER